MMRHLLYIICIAILSLTEVSAEECVLRFEPERVDFGHINESDGIVTRSFTIINTSAKEITISEIVSTCDCTVADYKNVVIAPKQSFEVKVSYNPLNRPGRFDRPLFIFVEGYDEPFEISIAGRVTPRERTIEEIYFYDMGHGLLFDNTFAVFAYVEHGKHYEERIALYNNSERTMRLRLKQIERSGAIKVEHPKRVAPHTSADIVFSYALPSSSKQYGSLDDKFEIRVNGKIGKYTLSAHGIAVDNFDFYDDILSPRAEYSKKIIKFGDIIAESLPLSATLTITNSGEAPLIIRDVRCSSVEVECRLKEGVSIAPGEVVAAEVVLTPKRDTPKGAFSAQVAIVTNDAITPYQVIRVTARYYENRK
jgi:hypothetical protein